MLQECKKCWWEGERNVPVFFDIESYSAHRGKIHQAEFEGRGLVAGPRVKSGFIYQVAFNERTEIALQVA